MRLFLLFRLDLSSRLRSRIAKVAARGDVSVLGEQGRPACSLITAAAAVSYAIPHRMIQFPLEKPVGSRFGAIIGLLEMKFVLCYVC
jgi:hypothetical protein